MAIWKPGDVLRNIDARVRVLATWEPDWVRVVSLDEMDYGDVYEWREPIAVMMAWRLELGSALLRDNDDATSG